MPKPTVTPDQFLSHLNARLRQHPSFREGMEFRPYPEGTAGKDMTGYSVTGPYELTGVYAEIAHSISADFDLVA